MILMLIQSGWTPLMNASHYGHTAIVQVLLADVKVQVNIKSKVSARCLIARCMVLIHCAEWKDCPELGQGEWEN